MIAFIGVPTALTLAQQDGLAFAVVAMMIFGMGHGILTVSFGYVTNMYFSADVYGRAKGWITTPRAQSVPLLAPVWVVFIVMGPDLFLPGMIAISILSATCFAMLLRQNRVTCTTANPAPREDM